MALRTPVPLACWEKVNSTLGGAQEGTGHPPDPNCPPAPPRAPSGSPWIVTVLHGGEAHGPVAHGMHEGGHQVLHEGTDGAEIVPADAGRAVHQEGDVGLQHVLAHHCGTAPGLRAPALRAPRTQGYSRVWGAAERLGEEKPGSSAPL